MSSSTHFELNKISNGIILTCCSKNTFQIQNFTMIAVAQQHNNNSNINNNNNTLVFHNKKAEVACVYIDNNTVQLLRNQRLPSLPSIKTRQQGSSRKKECTQERTL